MCVYIMYIYIYIYIYVHTVTYILFDIWHLIWFIYTIHMTHMYVITDRNMYVYRHIDIYNICNRIIGNMFDHWFFGGFSRNLIWWRGCHRTCFFRCCPIWGLRNHRFLGVPTLTTNGLGLVLLEMIPLEKVVSSGSWFPGLSVSKVEEGMIISTENYFLRFVDGLRQAVVHSWMLLFRCFQL